MKQDPGKAPEDAGPDAPSADATESFEPGPAKAAPPRQNSPMLVRGLVGAIVVAAFLGGYSLGNSGDSVSNDDLAALISEMQDNVVVPAQAPQPQPQAQGQGQGQGPEPGPGQAPAEPVFVSLDDDPIKGDPDAPVTIVEFSDFQCPFCSRFYQQTLPQLERNYIDTGMVNLVYRDMPLGIHSNAVPAHVAAECADEQDAFWQYHDVLFDRQSQWGRLGEAALDEQLKAYAEELELDSRFGECLVSPEVEAEVRHDHSQAGGYGVTGTPTFFVGNEDTGYTRLTGAQPYEAFQSIIDSKLG